jgi:hypothetical protein
MRGVHAALAMLVPFMQLNDMINAGVLLSLNMTNACVILLCRRTPSRVSTPQFPLRSVLGREPPAGVYADQLQA